MKKIPYCFLLLCIFVNLHSQEIDPHLVTQRASTNETKEIKRFLALSKKQYEEMDFKASQKSANKALLKSQKIHYSYGIAYSNFYIAQSLFDIGKPNIALQYLLAAEKEEYSQESPILMSDIYIKRSNIYSSLMMPGKAVEIQKQGFKFINKIKDKKSIVLQEIKAYNNLVYLYLAENNQDSIRFYLAKTKHNINIIGESRVPTEEITTNYNLIGISQLSNKHYDSVEYCLKKSLKIAKARKFKSTNFTYLIWGDMKKEMNQPDSALYYYTTALKNTQELRLTKAYPFIYHRIADVYQSKGNMEKSNEFNAKIIDFQDKSIKQISNNQEEAVENLITDEKTKSKTHITQYLIWFVLLTLIISILIFYYFTGRQRLIKNKINIQNSIIAEKEEKNLSLEQKINEAFDEVIRLAKENSTEFIKRFDEVYPTVIPTLLKIDPKLQTRELTFCGYLYLNFSTKEIAQYTFVTPRAVQLRKNRLRKKLNIPSDQDIYLWMKNKAMDHN